MKQLPKLSPAEASYIAGFFDGEGTVVIYEMKRPSGNPQFQIRLQITNTHEGVMRWCHKTLSGTLGVYNQTPQQATAWKITLQCQLAAQLLKEILPYLIVKKEQAELAIAFQDHLRTMKAKTHKVGIQGQIPLSIDEVAKRRDFVVRMKALKAKDKQYLELPRKCA